MNNNLAKTRITQKHERMGLLALVEYSLIKELCENVKKEKKSFTGTLKETCENEGSAPSTEKISEVRRLLLSGKRKAQGRDKKSKRKKKEKKPVEEPIRFRQHSSSNSGSSDTGSSTGSSTGDSSEDDFNTDGTGQSGSVNESRGNSQ